MALPSKGPFSTKNLINSHSPFPTRLFYLIFGVWPIFLTLKLIIAIKYDLCRLSHLKLILYKSIYL